MVKAVDGIGVLVVDDNRLLGESMERCLSDADGIRWLGWTDDQDAAESLVEQRRPDVMLLDVDMPGGDTLGLLRRVSTKHPTTKVVMLSGHYRQSFIKRTLDDGAAGYIVKDETPASIVQFVRRAAAGEVVLSPTAKLSRR